MRATVVFTLAVMLIAETAFSQDRSFEQASASETYFVDINQSFSVFGDYAYQEFTVYESTTFDLRFAADFSADAALIPASEFSNFSGGRRFFGYGVFDGVFGTKVSVTLAPGQYYAAIRNESSGPNTVRFEVDFRLTLSDGRFYDWYFGDAMVVQPRGGKAWQSFAIERGARYFLDGCNSGVETYIIPDTELANFLADRSFRYYEDYSGTDNAYPGLWELDLPPGNYTLVFRNTDSVGHAATWQAERWIPYQRLTGEDGPAGVNVVRSFPARPRRAATKGLQAAWVDASGAIRLTFVDRLEVGRLDASQFRIVLGDAVVSPSAVAYDASIGVLTLVAPEVQQTAARASVSWRNLWTASGMLNGSTDPLPRLSEALRPEADRRALGRRNR